MIKDCSFYNFDPLCQGMGKIAFIYSYGDRISFYRFSETAILDDQ